MQLIREEAASELGDDHFADTIAFGQYVAWDSGVTKALADLESTVRDHPGSKGARSWLALAFLNSERYPEALQQAIDAVRLSKDETDVGFAVGLVADAYVKLGKPNEAIAFLRGKAAEFGGGVPRATIYIKLSDMLSEALKNEEASIAMLELAVVDTPTDNDLRFKLAYRYTEQGLNSAALFHYREIIQRDRSHASALNNAGVAASQLKLPMLAVNYYRSSQENGEGLATANLASLLLGEGFEAEARKELERGSTAKVPHRNILTVTGDLARKEEAEESSSKEAMLSAKKWRDITKNVGSAILREVISTTAVSGVYVGTPTNLALNVDTEGNATGTFAFQPGKIASLNGKLLGSCMQFTWRHDPPPPTTPSFFSSLLLGSSGIGLIAFDGDRFEGYYASGSNPITENWENIRTSWQGIRVSEPPAELFPAAPPILPLARRKLLTE